jgi:hypothetical protein
MITLKNKPVIQGFISSAIYITQLTANGLVNTFTVPIGAIVLNWYIDRGVRYKFSEWNQTNQRSHSIRRFITNRSRCT